MSNTPNNISFTDTNGNPITEITSGQPFQCVVTCDSVPSSGLTVQFTYCDTGAVFPPSGYSVGYLNSPPASTTVNPGSPPTGSITVSTSSFFGANSALIITVANGATGAGVFNTITVLAIS